jgi:hypothetical protein
LHASGGDFTASLLECLEGLSTDTSSTSGGPPPAGDGFYYLVRTVGCGQSGTYDSGSASQQGSRDAEIAASPAACP